LVSQYLKFNTSYKTLNIYFTSANQCWRQICN